MKKLPLYIFLVLMFSLFTSYSFAENYEVVSKSPNDKDIQWVTLDLYNPYENNDSSNKTLN